MKQIIGQIIILLCICFFAFGQDTSFLTLNEFSISIGNNLKYESDEPKRFVIYRGFVVQYNYSQKAPNFTVHQLTVEQISPKHGPKAERRSSFFVDNNMRGFTATNRDYKQSGFDRGHMVPAGDFYWNKFLKDETFVLINIAPQTPVLNRGIWQSLENAIRERLLKLNQDAYVITGTLYNEKENLAIGPDKVGVPTYFYKIVYIPDSTVMYAFLFHHNVNHYYGGLRDYQVRVDDIEKLTQEDFYDKLPDDIESVQESTIIPFD